MGLLPSVSASDSFVLLDCLVLSDLQTFFFQSHKSEKEEENTEVNGVAEKEEEMEEEEEEDEDDESSDPDIEEEIQASTQQIGPGQSGDIHSQPLKKKISFDGESRVGFPAASSPKLAGPQVRFHPVALW